MTLIFEPRWKRTTPFLSQCSFTWESDHGFIERCEQDGEVGFYYSSRLPNVQMWTFCGYHAIYQESIWVAQARRGKNDESDL